MITVTITFGGLCMFVQKTYEGLWVLMPNLANDVAMRHCAMLIADHDPLTGKRVLYSLANQDIDLTVNAIATTAVKFPDPSYMFEASKYAENAPVAASYFTEFMPHGLIARVRMPLGTTLVPIINGQPGRLLVGKTPVPTTGMMNASFNIRDNKPLTVPVAYATVPALNFTAPPGGSIALTIANAPRSHIDLDARIYHSKGEPIFHPLEYYGLLDGVCGMDHDCPGVYSAEDVGTIDDPGYPACPTLPEILPPKSATKFIDPINCSVGSGCPTEDPC